MRTIRRDALPPAGRILVLNGPSSAGKTSIARLLQVRLQQPWLHLQLDAFRAMEPPGYFDAGQAAHNTLRVAALCRAMNAACREYALHGQNVIVDHALPPQGWLYLREDLAGLPVLLVGVHCDLEALQRRERERGDRPIGLAASQVPSLHARCSYDFEIDTTDASTEACALALAQWLESPVQLADG